MAIDDTPMRTKKTRILKIEYQRVLGHSISVRTWQRILKRLEIQDDRLDSLPVVRSYGKLRRSRKLVDRSDAENQIWLSENTPNVYCSGKQLFEALRKLKPVPSLATIYRWGNEIGVSFSVRRDYTPGEVNLWIERVAISGRWKKD